MDIQQFVEKAESIVIERISYLENESPGIYKKYLNRPEVPVMLAFLINATSEDLNQRQIVHDYIDGIILIECGKIEEGKALMERGIQSLDDFSGSEIMHKNFINAFLDPKSEITFGDFSFDVKESLGKYLKDNKVKLDSEEKFNVSLARLRIEKREWVNELKKIETKISSTVKSISTLEELLFDYKFCIQILMDFDPQIINHEYQFLLDSKKKFIIVAWIAVLKERGYFRIQIEDKELVQLLNNRISNLNLGKDGRIFRGDDKAYYYDDYLADFKTKIPKYTKH